jgi:hypothetical protein
VVVHPHGPVRDSPGLTDAGLPVAAHATTARPEPANVVCALTIDRPISSSRGPLVRQLANVISETTNEGHHRLLEADLDRHNANGVCSP